MMITTPLNPHRMQRLLASATPGRISPPPVARVAKRLNTEVVRGPGLGDRYHRPSALWDQESGRSPKSACCTGVVAELGATADCTERSIKGITSMSQTVHRLTLADSLIELC